MLKHKILDEHLVLTSHIGTILDYDVEHPISKKVKTYTAINTGDWVNVVAETKDHKIILVEQWRCGINETSIEIPGGKIDRDELPLNAALRELLEETGYGPGINSKLVNLGFVNANPAIQNNKMHFFYVNNVEKKQDTNFDEFELVYTHVYDRCKILEMLENGKISHAYAVLGLHKAFNH